MPEPWVGGKSKTNTFSVYVFSGGFAMILINIYKAIILTSPVFGFITSATV